jgi:hypothetical protein
MNNELDPYPGNLKRHDVRKASPEQIEFVKEFGIEKPNGVIMFDYKKFREMHPEDIKREPLLSDEHMRLMFAHLGIGFDQYGRKVRDWYESKITSGELRMEKTTKRMPLARVHTYGCEHCGTELVYHRFCPGCGAKIIEP